MDWLAAMLSKTKRVNGVDLSSSAFAWVGNEQDTGTWLLPLWIPGDALKSLNAVKTSLHRFDSAKLPDSERERAWFTLYGALLAHGIKTDRRTFAGKSDASTPAAEPAPPVKIIQTADVSDPAIAEAVALADHRATELLRSLGLE